MSAPISARHLKLRSIAVKDLCGFQRQKHAKFHQQSRSTQFSQLKRFKPDPKLSFNFPEQFRSRNRANDISLDGKNPLIAFSGSIFTPVQHLP